MKILTLAAGLGTRVQGTTYRPKAIHEINGKKLIQISLASYHALIAREHIKASDLSFAISKSDDEKFGVSEILIEIFGSHIGIVVIEELTRGPAETAFLAITRLAQEGFLNLDDELIINDCDHSFVKKDFLRVINGFHASNDNSFLLLGATKNELDNQWCVPELFEKQVIRLHEKAEFGKITNVDYSLGVVGAYIFKRGEDFISNFSKLTGRNVTGELFVSGVLNEMIKDGHVGRISGVDVFIPLGTREQIEIGEKKLSSTQGFHESGTIFLDLDGTLIEHDPGIYNTNGTYNPSIKILNTESLTFLNSLWLQGHLLILTTARPENQRLPLEKQLQDLGLKFDQLICGLNGGPRLLVNDTKPSLPGMGTAYSANIDRNQPFLNEALSELSKVMSINIHKVFSGESGEITYLYADSTDFFVRKVSQETQNSKDILKYQVDWFQKVGEFLPQNVPSVVTYNSKKSDTRHYYDTRYIHSLRPVGEGILDNSFEEMTERLDKVLLLLSVIYTKFKQDNYTNVSYLKKIFYDKALPGYLKASEKIKSDRMGIFTEFKVNGREIRNVWAEIENLVTDKEDFWEELFNKEKSLPTLIHGDPTLSNLVINNEGTIYLLDPIGTRVRPDFKYDGNLGRTDTLFDYSRIRLSLVDEYERWQGDIAIETTPEGIPNYTFSQKSLSGEGLKYLDRNWPSGFSSKNQILRELIHLTTMCRILPYKLASKPNEAAYMLFLIELQLGKVKDLIVK